MKLEQNNIHTSFQINGKSFSSVDELLNYTKATSETIYQFLTDWFSGDDFICIKTSGSTGKPKLIKLQKVNMINSALATGIFFDLKENTTALLCLPTEYIAGKMMLIRAIVLGWKLDVIEADSYPLKNSNKVYDFSAMVPLQLENSLDRLEKVKKVIVGGGVVSKELQNKLKNKTTQVFATYGMTETVTHIAVKKLNNLEIKPAFYHVLPNVTIYKNEDNCLVIDAQKVAEEIIFTNDVVALISDTEFEWLGRFDNVINSGGIKLHPERIEEKLSEIIDQRFFVAGIPDKKLGEKLVLVVEGNHQNISFKNSNLSKFGTPKEIYFVNEFIETETKKIQRNKTLDLINFIR